jgi:hypothetical protein
MTSGEIGSWAGARPEADTRTIIEEKREVRIIYGTGGGRVSVRMVAVVRWHGLPFREWQCGSAPLGGRISSLRKAQLEHGPVYQDAAG